MEIIQGKGIPESNGHYSMCIAHNGCLYISGQLPMHSNTREVPSTIEEQTKLVLDKINNIVNAAGSSKDQIIQMRVYISDIALWDKVNDVYANFFGSHKPVRVVIPTNKLHFGCMIEIEGMAAMK